MIFRSVCTTCGHVGASEEKTPGSVLIEIFLWFAFIVPGIAYSIWRRSSRKDRCAGCQRDTVIAAGSPNGIKLLADRGGWLESDEASFKAVVGRAEAATMWGWATVSALVAIFVSMAAKAPGLGALFFVGMCVSLVVYMVKS